MIKQIEKTYNLTLCKQKQCMIIHVASLERLRVKTPGPMFSLNYKALDTGGEVIRIFLTRDSNKPISLQHLNQS